MSLKFADHSINFYILHSRPEIPPITILIQEALTGPRMSLLPYQTIGQIQAAVGGVEISLPPEIPQKNELSQSVLDIFNVLNQRNCFLQFHSAFPHIDYAVLTNESEGPLASNLYETLVTKGVKTKLGHIFFEEPSIINCYGSKLGQIELSPEYVWTKSLLPQM